MLVTEDRERRRPGSCPGCTEFCVVPTQNALECGRRRNGGWSMFTKQKRLGSEWTYALFGIVIGICAPIGQLLLRLATNAAARQAPLEDLRSALDFYGYQLIGTCIVFGLAGFAAGRRAERLRRAEEFYHSLSERDSLTGLLNGRAFEDRCTRVMGRAVRLSEPVSMMII